MRQSQRSPCDPHPGAGKSCPWADDERAENERLRRCLAEAIAEACAAYQDNALLVRVLSIIAQPSSPEKLTDEVLHALSQTYNADLVCIARHLGDRLVLLDACGLPEADPAFTDGWPAGPTAVTALRGSAAIGTSRGEFVDPRDVPDTLAHLRIRSVAWVPVRSDLSSTDILLILFRRGSDAFAPGELRGLESVAARLSVGLDARARAMLAERLARSGHRLARHLSFPILFRDASTLLQELLGASGTCVITVDGDEASQGWPARGHGDGEAGWPRPVSTLPGWEALAGGRAFQSPVDESFAVCGPGPGARTALCVPVMSRDQPVALLYAVREATRPFLPSEVEATTTFAYYLHSAMINTELYQALKDNETTLRHRASHDTLTGLANRALVSEYLDGALSRDDPSDVGLLFCDLDKFKGINDRLGHGVGDALLQLVAERLRECAEPGVLLARLGGDEFVFVLDGVEDADDLTAFAGRVTETMRRPFTLRGEILEVTLSVGAVSGRRRQATSMSLLRDADAAMYAAKARGAGLVRVFDEDAATKAREQLDLRSDLHLALERGELAVHFQPIFDLITGEIVAFEALLRWHHPVRGLIPPDRFIPLAEESGDIIPIGNWVLDRACENLALWRRIPAAADLSVSVNLSPRQLHRPESAHRLLDIITGSGVDPSAVWFEITESGAVHGRDARDFLATLRSAGVHFSLDDFGTSYSNLSHLRQVSVERLKIDCSFVAGLIAKGHQRDVDRGLVQAILAIGSSLGLSIVAEGIETPLQRALLATLGCQLGQGYLLSGALPPETATRLLLTGPRLGRLGAETSVDGRRPQLLSEGLL
jgi:diguanylate cyclase (GGDEF)-like protein